MTLSYTSPVQDDTAAKKRKIRCGRIVEFILFCLFMTWVAVLLAPFSDNTLKKYRGGNNEYIANYGFDTPPLTKLTILKDTTQTCESLKLGSTEKLVSFDSLDTTRSTKDAVAQKWKNIQFCSKKSMKYPLRVIKHASEECNQYQMECNGYCMPFDPLGCPLISASIASIPIEKFNNTPNQFQYEDKFYELTTVPGSAKSAVRTPFITRLGVNSQESTRHQGICNTVFSNGVRSEPMSELLTIGRDCETRGMFTMNNQYQLLDTYTTGSEDKFVSENVSLENYELLEEFISKKTTPTLYVAHENPINHEGCLSSDFQDVDSTISLFSKENEHEYHDITNLFFIIFVLACISITTYVLGSLYRIFCQREQPQRPEYERLHRVGEEEEEEEKQKCAFSLVAVYRWINIISLPFILGGYACMNLIKLFGNYSRLSNQLVSSCVQGDLLDILISENFAKTQKIYFYASIVLAVVLGLIWISSLILQNSSLIPHHEVYCSRKKSSSRVASEQNEANYAPSVQYV